MTSAVEFLREHGHTSLISLGCGKYINSIDNHIRLLSALKLSHYVAIDREPSIHVEEDSLFTDRTALDSPLNTHFDGDARRLSSLIKAFSGTWAEELHGIPCSVVICQRVLPYLHWEEVIVSMNPLLVLQEDLHGCELQDLNDPRYTKSRTAIHHYGLRPFRPWRVLPGEFNLILWKQKDFVLGSGSEERRVGRLRHLLAGLKYSFKGRRNVA